MNIYQIGGLVLGGYGLMYLVFRVIDQRLTRIAARENLIRGIVGDIDAEWKHVNRAE